MVSLSFLSTTTCHNPMCSDSASASLSSTPLDEATHQQPLPTHGRFKLNPFVILSYSKDGLFVSVRFLVSGSAHFDCTLYTYFVLFSTFV